MKYFMKYNCYTIFKKIVFNHFIYQNIFFIFIILSNINSFKRILRNILINFYKKIVL